MNNLFISLYMQDEEESVKGYFNNKKDYLKYNLLKYDFATDMLNNEFGNNMSLKLNYEYVANNVLSSKKGLRQFYIKQNLKNELSRFKDVNIILDKSFDDLNETEKVNVKKFLDEVLPQNNISFNEIVASNDMYENDIKYIEEFIKAKRINRQKLKILLILNDGKDFDVDKLTEYISNYKFVDILKMPNVSKHDYKCIQKSVEKINKEYGSTIDIIQKRNIQDYSIYIMFSKVQYTNFSTHYILRKISKYIDMKNEDFDIYNQNICKYERNKSYILTLSTRLNIDLSRYSKNKIGQIF